MLYIYNNRDKNQDLRTKKMYHLLKNVDPITLNAIADNEELRTLCLLHMTIKSLYDALDVVNTWSFMEDGEKWRTLASNYALQMKSSFIIDWDDLKIAIKRVNSAYTYIQFKYCCLFYVKPVSHFFENVGWKMLNDNPLVICTHQHWFLESSLKYNLIKIGYDKEKMYAIYLWESVRILHQKEFNVNVRAYPNVFNWKVSKLSKTKTIMTCETYVGKIIYDPHVKNMLYHASLMYCSVMCNRGELLFLKYNARNGQNTFYLYDLKDNIVFESVWVYFYYKQYSFLDDNDRILKDNVHYVDNPKIAKNRVLDRYWVPTIARFNQYVENQCIRVIPKTSNESMENPLFLRLKSKLTPGKPFDLDITDVPTFIKNVKSIKSNLKIRVKMCVAMNRSQKIPVQLFTAFCIPNRITNQHKGKNNDNIALTEVNECKEISLKDLALKVADLTHGDYSTIYDELRAFYATINRFHVEKIKDDRKYSKKRKIDFFSARCDEGTDFYGNDNDTLCHMLIDDSCLLLTRELYYMQLTDKHLSNNFA